MKTTQRIQQSRATPTPHRNRMGWSVKTAKPAVVLSWRQTDLFGSHSSDRGPHRAPENGIFDFDERCMPGLGPARAGKIVGNQANVSMIAPFSYAGTSKDSRTSLAA